MNRAFTMHLLQRSRFFATQQTHKSHRNHFTGFLLAGYLKTVSSRHLPEKDVSEIENLLTQYPAGGIWKGLIQNADDGGATELHFGFF